MDNEIRFNINQYVKVKITKHGKDILVKDEYPYPYKEDKDGWSKWQMWHLMEQFGQYIYLGCEPPFETEIILLPRT